MKNIIWIVLLALATVFILPPVTHAQTAWADSGATIDLKTDGSSILINYQGYLKGTDTLISEQFTVKKAGSQIFDVYKYINAADTGKITIKRQVQLFSGVWSDAKTLVTSDSIKTVNWTKDTIQYNPNYCRWAFIGTSGNGTHTRFYMKVKIRR